MNGHDLKEAALASLKSTRGEIILRARRVFLQHAIEHGQVTADDVHDVIELPPGVNSKALGCVPTPFARAGIVERTGFCNSIRPDAHARPLSLWKLTDRSAAERWLEEHPEPAAVEPAPVDSQGQGLLFDVGHQSATSEGF